MQTEPDHTVGVRAEPGDHSLTPLQQVQDVFSCHLKTTFVLTVRGTEELARAGQDCRQVRAELCGVLTAGTPAGEVLGLAEHRLPEEGGLQQPGVADGQLLPRLDGPAGEDGDDVTCDLPPAGRHTAVVEQRGRLVESPGYHGHPV